MILTKSVLGYSHIKSGKPCQDFSASYHDEERTIITSCDGHGGDVYIRSNLGSKFASTALIRVLSEMDIKELRKLSEVSAQNKLKLNLLCEWNGLVERHLSKHSIRKSEIEGLKRDDIMRLRKNPTKAYGTTMIGAMVVGSKLIAVQIGDGGAFLLRRGKAVPIFEETEDEPVANITYSMCEEDAFQHIQVGVFDFKHYDGVLLCTDGFINPYMSYENFEHSFVHNVAKEIEHSGVESIERFVEDMGKSRGNGDDVTLSLYMRDRVRKRIKKAHTDAKSVPVEEDIDIDEHAETVEKYSVVTHQETVRDEKADAVIADVPTIAHIEVVTQVVTHPDMKRVVYNEKTINIVEEE